MYLISTGDKTVLSSFPDLKTKSIYAHTYDETTDFQCYEHQRLFVEVYKKSGCIELMRLKDVEGQPEIKRVLKLNVEKAFSVGCAKKSPEEMVFGFSNGLIRLYNYKKSQFIHSFQPDKLRTSISFLDYNASDEYIAAVYESGDINIFGTKTKTKIDSVNIDKCSTVARFHPTKRLHLAITSHTATVTVYDIQSKKRLMHMPNAHASPCRDLCMSAAMPDLLLTAGYDCKLNIIDTRQKKVTLTKTYAHPLSSVAITPCGQFFCLGNLKGELSAFDLRNISHCLASNKVYNNRVCRLAFAPDDNDESSQRRSDSLLPNSRGKGINDDAALTKVDTPSLLIRDSFTDFLDFQSNVEPKPRVSGRAAGDSFDWQPKRRPSTSLMNLQELDGSGDASLGSNANMSLGSTRRASLESVCAPLTLDFVNTKKRGATTQALRERNSLLSRPGQQRSEGKLMDIQEEQQRSSERCDSDKENPLPPELEVLPSPHHSSTPNREIATKPPTPAAGAEAAAAQAVVTDDVATQLAALRTDMETRFQRLESNLKFNAETNKWHTYTQSFNMWNKHYQLSAEMHDALSILLQTDPFVSEYLRLKEENEVLKSKLQQLGHEQ